MHNQRRKLPFSVKGLPLILLLFMISHCQKSSPKWKPATGQLFTKWAAEISPNKVHPEYPRTQLVRKNWLNLNGLWEYSIRPKDEGQPENYDGQILVPFPIESALSGVGKLVGEENRLWYRRTFDIPKEWINQRLLLNFGAVDWETQVWLNGKEIGQHRGGYDAFTFDITEAVNQNGSQEIVLSVWDPVEAGTQPRGKQVTKPRGIWYTSVTGIWQTVWLEPVQEAHIKSLKIVPDIDAELVSITTECSEATAGLNVVTEVKEKGQTINRLEFSAGDTMNIPIKNPKFWSPDSPFLYDLSITLHDENGKIVDEVSSYFGMRKISLGKDENGILKLFLNNEELFQFGPLDQGWWPDGLYSAPTDEALRYDIEVTKKLGFNMARKHVKIEPQRWYYWCDQLGLLVWQDMPSGDQYIGHEDPDLQRSEESAQQFELELARLIHNFGNHPSIVMWVPFNEGWGQYDTPRIVNLIKTLDPSCLVNNTSGWADRGVGDVHDIHSYPGPDMPELELNRAAVLGEFGGLGLPVPGHTWQDEDNWGYRQYNDPQSLTEAYRDLITKLQFFRSKGLSAAVYTQTTDVEIEVNGLMTYDRAIIKMNPAEVARINQGYLPPIIQSENNIFLDFAQVKIFNVTQPGEIRYTLDGTEPTNQSTLYEKPISISETSTVKAKTFWHDGTESGVSEQTFKKVTYREPEKIGRVKAGIRFSYFENNHDRWRQLPDFGQLTPNKSGVIAKFDLSQKGREEHFGFVFDGLIRAPEDGIYTFYLESDDGSQLYIGLELVVDNDFTHGMIEKSGQIALKAGLHPINVTFFQGMGGKGLKVSYKGSGVEKQEIPALSLFHEE